MSHFAKVENGIVTEVIVAEQDFIDTGLVGEPSLWVQTSYNTYGNIHSNDGTPLRGNYAGVGYTYDEKNDVFYAPSSFPSWVLNEITWLWQAPVSQPDDGEYYVWNEDSLSWTKA